MIESQVKPIDFEDFIEGYPDDGKRYELIEGVIVEMLPTGSHEDVSGFLIAELNFEIRRQNLPYSIPRTCIIKPDRTQSGYQPDVIVINRDYIENELLMRDPEHFTVSFRGGGKNGKPFRSPETGRDLPIFFDLVGVREINTPNDAPLIPYGEPVIVPDETTVEIEVFARIYAIGDLFEIISETSDDDLSDPGVDEEPIGAIAFQTRSKSTPFK